MVNRTGGRVIEKGDKGIRVKGISVMVKGRRVKGKG